MKRAIVIGATSGIGRALAERLAAEGYRVGVTGRREALLEELAASRPGSFCYAAADIMDPAAACAALERLAGELGGMDLCVVSAGTGDLNDHDDDGERHADVIKRIDKAHHFPRRKGTAPPAAVARADVLRAHAPHRRMRVRRGMLRRTHHEHNPQGQHRPPAAV